MKGYNLIPPEYKPVEENALVGCRRCRATWREKYLHSTPVRINGPMYIYDVCDKCIEPGDVVEL